MSLTDTQKENVKKASETLDKLKKCFTDGRGEYLPKNTGNFTSIVNNELKENGKWHENMTTLFTTEQLNSFDALVELVEKQKEDVEKLSEIVLNVDVFDLIN